MGQAGVAFDPVDLRRNAARNGGGVSGSGSHIEDVVGRFDLECLEHERDDIRLRDRLLLIDRQRGILVSEFHQLVRDERFARHLGHRAQDLRVADIPGRQLPFDHLVLGGTARNSHIAVIPHGNARRGMGD